MLCHMSSSFLVLFLMTSSTRGATVTFPLDHCEQLKNLNYDIVAGASLTDLVSETGPDGYDVYAYTNPSSSLVIPQTAFGLSQVYAISFNLKLNSHGQNKTLFQMLDSTGKGLVVEQYGQDLNVFSTFPAIPSLNDNINKTLSNIPLNTWNAIKFSTGLPFIIFNSIYLATLNGAILASDNADYPPYPMGDFQVFSFDGALSCLTLNDAGDDTQLTIGGTQCVNFVELCAGDQSTPPTVNPFPGATCDVSDVSNCNSVTFTGAGFTSGDTYTCGIQRYELNTAGQLTATTTETFAASSFSDTQVTCDLSASPSSAAVTLVSSTHGDLATGNVVIFPEQCFYCDVEFACITTDQGCYINSRCLDPYVFVNDNFSQICLPSLDPLGPSLRQDEDVDIKIKSCGKTKGIELTETEGGFISENFALAAASFDINLNFVARVDCDSGNETVLLAEFAPGIKIYQLGTKIFMELHLIDIQTGQNRQQDIEIEIDSGNWRILRRRGRKMQWWLRKQSKKTLKENWPKWYRSAYKKFRKCPSKGDCAVTLAFSHDPQSGETALFINGENREDQFEETQGLQLLTTGQAFVSSDRISCFQISNDVAHRFGNEKKSRNCFQFVCQHRNCKHKKSQSNDSDEESDTSENSSQNTDTSENSSQNTDTSENSSPNSDTSENASLLTTPDPQ